jgi:hypothetical protein
MIYACVECGEPATQLHPDYSDGTDSNSDHICNPCYIAVLEEKLDEAIENLREGVRVTGEVSITMSFIEAVESRQ